MSKGKGEERLKKDLGQVKTGPTMELERSEQELSAEEAKAQEVQREADEQMLAKTFKLIEEGERHLESCHNSNAVLLIGKTGVGKSTLANYLAGVKIVAKKIEIKIEGTELTDEIFVLDAEDALIKIGHGLVSETALPNRWYDKEHNKYCILGLSRVW